MKVFIDTGAFLALEIQNDQFHPHAADHFSILKKKRALPFTNTYVLDELFTYDTGFRAVNVPTNPIP